MVLHHRPAAEIADVQITPHSFWRDNIWRFNRLLPGKERTLTVFNWEVPITPGHLLTDVEFHLLLDAFKRFMWSLLVDRRYGKNLRPETAAVCLMGIRRLAPWMIANNYPKLSDLTADSSLEYVDDLAEEAAAAEVDLRNGRPFNKDDFIRALKVWSHLSQQRDALLPAGIVIFEGLPFGGRTSYELSSDLAEDTATKVPPLPDEVAIPILQSAIRMVKHGAGDVIKAQGVVLETRNKIGTSGSNTKDAKRGRQNKALKRVTFSIIPGEAEPWHPPLSTWSTAKRYPDKQDKVELPPIDALRNLISVVRSSCLIVLQGLTGIRINEFCSFKGGINVRTGLPQCVEIDRSLDGLTDLYYVSGLITKGRERPEPARWLLGSRPVSHELTDLHDLPLPVVAISVLEELYRPWRELGNIDSLVVSFSSSPRALPSLPSQIATPSSENLRRWVKHFVLNQVDLSHLPDTNWRGEDLAIYRDSSGTIIRTHQWRKTFAHYVLLTRSNLLQAVSQHFKHLSLAMTEQGYLVDDPFLRGMLGEASLEATVEFFSRASRGEPLSGRLGELLARHREELVQIGGGADRKSSETRLRDWVRIHDLRIFHTESGRCGIGLMPLEARCHKIAGTTHWANKEPNFEVREPAVCVGCSCYAIDRETAPFWVARWRENTEIYAEASSQGLANEYRVALRRAEQAAAILRNLGMEVQDAENAFEEA